MEALAVLAVLPVLLVVMVLLVVLLLVAVVEEEYFRERGALVAMGVCMPTKLVAVQVVALAVVVEAD
jgi:hypothetical protein